MLRSILMVMMFLSFLLTACGTGVTPVPPAAIPPPTVTRPPAVNSPTPTATLTSTAEPMPTSVQSFQTGQYRNLFQEYLGHSDAAVKEKIKAAWDQLFYGNDSIERVYYPVGKDAAYIEDIGNGDVRTEGMSYGMMIAVELNKQAEFNRLWKWAVTNMYQTDGPYQGYFAWHCDPDGNTLAANPASDGEEWFVTALLFASARWGDGAGIFNYRDQAQKILDTMLHKNDEDNGIATNMFDPTSKQVVFVPSGRNSTFSDPSYHLPAYYELWARAARKENAFWTEAAQASRALFHAAANPQTGLMPDYTNFDGTPADPADHKDFRYDAWRTLSNVAVDYAWFGVDPWQAQQSNRVLTFLASQGPDSYPNQFSLEGKPLSSDHSTGLVAMAAVAALAAGEETGKPFVEALWNTKIPSGQWRYYDGLLYLLGLLHVSGEFQIYLPGG
ncbi:MAG: glycosyl hydrolase family 8 [Anaerolineales bacterium]